MPHLNEGVKWKYRKLSFPTLSLNINTPYYEPEIGRYKFSIVNVYKEITYFYLKPRKHILKRYSIFKKEQRCKEFTFS